MNVNEKIFKSYDIRGIYPDEINEDAAAVIARAYDRLIGSRKIVVGRDMRLASPALTEMFIRTMLGLGADVVDIGEVPVDAFYYYLGTAGLDGGVYCTASHNPKEYHGFKCFKKNIDTVRGVDLKEVLGKIDFSKKSSQPGTLEKKDIMEEFIRYILTFSDVSKIRPFRVVVDAGNGMAGKTIPYLQKHLPISITPLSFELDGNFPSHPSNPLEPESQKVIIKKVVDTGADLGVIFDGDSDRVFFVDETGRFVPADMTLLILAKYVIAKNPGAGVVYNAICSRAVSEFVEKWGGKSYRSRVGFVNVSECMKKNDAMLGGEVSAHYAFKDNFFADSGNIAFLQVLQILSEDEKKLSELLDELRIYVRGDELNIRVEDIPSKIRVIQEKYSDGKHDHLDGITVSYEDYWFNVRPSNTEPLLRITIEAKDKRTVQEKQNELLNFIENN